MNLNDRDLLMKRDGRRAESGAECICGARACCGNDEELHAGRTHDDGADDLSLIDRVQRSRLARVGNRLQREALPDSSRHRRRTDHAQRNPVRRRRMQRTHIGEDEQRLHRERDRQPDEEPAVYPCSGVRNAVIHRSLQTRSPQGAYHARS